MNREMRVDNVPRAFFDVRGIMNEKQKAILVSIAKSQSDVETTTKSLDELERLLDTAGGEAVARVIQVKESFDPRTCIGAGKVQEIRGLLESTGADTVVFDFELSPSQIRNLEDAFGECRVIDRTVLILDIFARHAVTGEGKLQVELAQLKYTVPRLIGKGAALSRLGGGIGTRGPGESKLESDKRHLHERIHALEKQLKELAETRKTMRAARDRSGMTKVALVGYTNAGKSTLLNALTDAGVLCEDKLFATLDPTTRRLMLPDGQEVLLTDTVGFIRNLPHHLIHAFRSTLDEVVYADVILLVTDATDPEANEHIQVTEALLEELGANNKQLLYVYNKCDNMPEFPHEGLKRADNRIYISADKGWGLGLLLQTIADTIRGGKERVVLTVPYADMGCTASLRGEGIIESQEYTETGVRFTVLLDRAYVKKYDAYICHE